MKSDLTVQMQERDWKLSESRRVNKGKILQCTLSGKNCENEIAPYKRCVMHRKTNNGLIQNKQPSPLSLHLPSESQPSRPQLLQLCSSLLQGRLYFYLDQESL